MMRIVAAAVFAAGLWLVTGSAHAVPTHYWQFEDAPGFLSDSIGSTSLTADGTPSQVLIPGVGRGSEFAGSGSTQAADLDLGDAFTTSLSPTEDFTLELLTHFDTDPPQSGYVLGGFAAGDLIGEIGWILHTRQANPTGPDILSLTTVNGFSATVWSSFITLETGKDYYLALAFDSLDAGGGTATFYVQDLTDGGPLQSSSTTLNAGNFIGFNDISTFVIGDDVFNLTGFDGLMDEVRLSDSALSQEELLISVPEPSVPTLLLVAWVAGRVGRRARAVSPST